MENDPANRCVRQTQVDESWTCLAGLACPADTEDQVREWPAGACRPSAISVTGDDLFQRSSPHPCHRRDAESGLPRRAVKGGLPHMGGPVKRTLDAAHRPRRCRMAASAADAEIATMRRCLDTGPACLAWLGDQPRWRAPIWTWSSRARALVAPPQEAAMGIAHHSGCAAFDWLTAGPIAGRVVVIKQHFVDGRHAPVTIENCPIAPPTSRDGFGASICAYAGWTRHRSPSCLRSIFRLADARARSATTAATTELHWASRTQVLRVVGRLLRQRWGGGRVAIAARKPAFLRQFCAQQAVRHSKPGGAGSVVTALHGDLRYRASPAEHGLGTCGPHCRGTAFIGTV